MYSMGCPKCGGSDGTLNLKAEHWGTCNTHGLKWHIGTDLFQNWRQENDRVWFDNAVFLQGFQTVEPVRRWKP